MAQSRLSICSCWLIGVLGAPIMLAGDIAYDPNKQICVPDVSPDTNIADVHLYFPTGDWGPTPYNFEGCTNISWSGPCSGSVGRSDSVSLNRGTPGTDCGQGAHVDSGSFDACVQTYEVTGSSATSYSVVGDCHAMRVTFDAESDHWGSIQSEHCGDAISSVNSTASAFDGVAPSLHIPFSLVRDSTLNLDRFRMSINEQLVKGTSDAVGVWWYLRLYAEIRITDDDNGQPGAPVVSAIYHDLFSVLDEFGDDQQTGSDEWDFAGNRCVDLDAGDYWLVVILQYYAEGGATANYFTNGGSGNICYQAAGNVEIVLTTEDSCCQYSSCDTNCDGTINPFDVDPFLDLLDSGTPCSSCAGDTNHDGSINTFDIDGFLACLDWP